MSEWQPIGTVDPRTLAGERLQLHYGTWILGSVAHSLLPAQDDDGHSNLGFDDGARFSTWPLSEGRSVQLTLDLPALELVFREGGEGVAALGLVGKTMADAYAWTREFAKRGLPGAADIAVREYPDFPEGELARGAPFQAGSRGARAELALWFANALGVMEEMAEPGMSAIRTWPHHFDIGALIELGAGNSIGLGLSPGDGGYDEPYIYVSPYPSPDPSHLPALEGPGHWHTQGFISNVLTATELLAAGGDQGEIARAFVRGATGRCRQLLG